MAPITATVTAELAAELACRLDASVVFLLVTARRSRLSDKLLRYARMSHLPDGAFEPG